MHNHTFVWALLLSLVLHVVAALQLPGLKREPPALPKTLEVELVMQEPSQAPTPEAQSAPEPPPPPKEIPRPRPEPEPLPKPKPIPKPENVVEPPPPEAPQEPVTEPAPPAVISTEPVEEKIPEFTAPPPPPKPPEPRGPTPEDMDAARNQYGSLLAREIAKHKQYPRIAQMRGWQGETLLELQIDSNGKVISSRIHTPSSYEVLDKQALEMVKRASPFPLPPAALRGQTFTLLVPIAFRLE